MAVVIVNRSDLIDSAQLLNIITGLNLLLIDFANDWKTSATQCILGPSTEPGYKLYILDSTDAPGAVGYHDESADGPYGRVFVKTILDSNGTIYEDVSKTIAHEVMEILINPYANMWWQLPNGTVCAGEVCDPVQENSVIVKVGAQNITYSDWILPKWTDQKAKVGPFNHLDTLTKPFAMSKGGYMITMSTSSDYTVVGEKPTACLRSKRFT